MDFNRSKPYFKKSITNFKHDYPDAKEEMSSISSLSFGLVIQSTIIIDTNPDHTRDQVTRRSLIELVGYVDSTPITWMKKIQY